MSEPTIDDLNDMADEMLVRLGRALAPAVNERLSRIKPKPRPKDYCPGCGELSSWGKDLCPECLGASYD